MRIEITQARPPVPPVTPDITRTEKLERDLGMISARVATLEGTAGGAPWPGWTYVAIGLAGLGVAITFLWLWSQKFSLMSAIAALAAIGLTATVTLFSFKLDSLLKVTIGAGGDGRPRIIVLGRENERVTRQPAYAINFAQTSEEIPAEAGIMIDRFATALRPCVDPRATLRLEVAGFSSSAPFLRQSRPQSNDSNLLLSRSRAGAIERRLRAGICGTRRLCGPDLVDIRFPDRFSYNGMSSGRPLGDASTPQNIRRATEYLSRTALITLVDAGGCAYR